LCNSNLELNVRDSAEAALPGEMFKGIRLPRQAPLGAAKKGPLILA
jgi:hypothetical protein